MAKTGCSKGAGVFPRAWNIRVVTEGVAGPGAVKAGGVAIERAWDAEAEEVARAWDAETEAEGSARAREADVAACAGAGTVG